MKVAAYIVLLASGLGFLNLQRAEVVTARRRAAAVVSISPTLVQAVDDSDWSPLLVGPVGSTNTIDYFFSHNTTAGNAIVVAVSIDDNGSAALPTVTDSNSDTFSTGTRCNDATNGESIVTFTAPNIAGGGNRVRVTYNASNGFGPYAVISEWAGLAASSIQDKATCNHATGTSVSAGASGTLAHSGDLILQFAWNDTLAYTANTSNPGNGVHYTKGSAGSLTWKLLNNSSVYAFGSEYAVYGSTATITPSFTISTANYVSAAIYLVPCTTCGSVPTGPRVLYRKDQPTNTFGTTPTVFAAIPSSAKTLVLNWAAANVDITAQADSHTNTYASTHAFHCDTGNNTCIHNRYAAGVTASEDMTFSPTFGSTPGSDSLSVYGISGLNASTPFDVAVVNSGQQTVAGSLTYLSISPTTSNGLVLFNGSLFFNTHSTFSSPSGALTHTCFLSDESLNSGGCMANNPWGMFVNPNTTSETWTGTFQSGSTAVSFWAAEADAFKQ